jgi:hypothetical protein
MGLADGFGMLAVGLIAIAIGGTIIFYVINRNQKEDE